MKLNIKFLTFSCIVLGLCFTSCSKGEDGKIGGQGIQGITGQNGTDGNTGQNGADGADGTDGINGTDGNANAQTIVFDATQLNGAVYSFNVEEITASTLKNDVILSYLRIGNLNFPMPGLSVGSQFLTRVFASEGKFEVRFSEPDGVTPYITIEGEVKEILIIIIKSTSSASKSSSPLAELNAAGVDVKDYNAVMKYYGLN